MILAKRNLQLDQLGKLGDELYRSIFKVAQTLKEICAATLSSAEHQAMITYSLEREAKNLLPNQLFALWWLFVPEDEGRKEEKDGPSEVKRDVAVLDMGNFFYSTLIDYLSATTTMLTSITLRYNWILKKATQRALTRNGCRLKHVTLLGSNNDDMLEMLAEYCRLKSLTALDITKAFGLPAVERFLKSHEQSLEHLNVTRLVDLRYMSGQERISFLELLSKVSKLSSLRTDGLCLSAESIEAMQQVPVFENVKSLVFAATTIPQPWLGAAFPACQSLCIINGGCATIESLLQIPSSWLQSVDTGVRRVRDDSEAGPVRDLAKILHHCRNATDLKLNGDLALLLSASEGMGEIRFPR